MCLKTVINVGLIEKKKCITDEKIDWDIDKAQPAVYTVYKRSDASTVKNDIVNRRREWQEILIVIIERRKGGKIS